jgi:hypothetical protein
MTGVHDMSAGLSGFSLMVKLILHVRIFMLQLIFSFILLKLLIDSVLEEIVSLLQINNLHID